MVGLTTSVRDGQGDLIAEAEHYFMPALALNIAHENGLAVDCSLSQRVEALVMGAREEGDLWRWDETKDQDYDDTLVARTFLASRGHRSLSTILLNFQQSSGGLFTYIREKEHNNVCPVINTIYLKYCVDRSLHVSHTLKEYLLKASEDAVDCDVSHLSRYYLSNAYFYYLLKVSGLVDNVDQLIRSKISVSKNKAEVALFIMGATDKILGDLRRSYDAAEQSGLKLFRQQSKSYLFSCALFDEIVCRVAEDRLGKWAAESVQLT